MSLTYLSEHAENALLALQLAEKEMAPCWYARLAVIFL